MKELILGSMLATACCFATTATTALAQEAKIELKASTTMKDLLTENTGKRVAIKLVSGEEIGGTVTSVGNSLVHISKLAGKEFYDAAVSIDRISAVSLKVRDK